MGIVDEDVERTRQASDLVAIAGQYVALRRVGRRWQGLCPFHAERSPSFSVNAEEGLYYCFGCGARGDVITFVREMEHVDFVGAVEWLAVKAGVQLRYTDAGESQERKRRARLVAAVERAVVWYGDRLLSAPDAGPARAYLRSRGYERDVVQRYRLGWAPDEWDALCRALDLPDDVLRDSGLGFVNRAGRRQDAFRARVLFPILDAQGDPVGFGGRSLPGAEGPKYKNSPDSALYHKSRTLYGLNWAKSAIVQHDRAVLCEGYTDVIGLHQAGVAEAVATCGTALTEEHVRLLTRYSKRLVLAFDPDAAGQAAAERVYEWERRHEIEVSVAPLPAGADPADLARTDPDALLAAIAEPVPFLRFRLDRVLAGADLSTPERRARAAEQAVAVIAEHPSDLVRDQYLMDVADRCRVPVERLRARAAARGTAGPEAGPPARPPRRRVGHDSPELEALRLAVHRPAEVAPYLDDVLFADPLHVEAFHALASAATLHEAIDRASPEVADLLQRLAVEESEAETDDVLRRLVDGAGGRALAGLQAEARTLADPVSLAPTVAWLKLRIEELRAEDTGLDAARQLLAWLAERAGRGDDGFRDERP